MFRLGQLRHCRKHVLSIARQNHAIAIRQWQSAIINLFRRRSGTCCRLMAPHSHSRFPASSTAFPKKPRNKRISPDEFRFWRHSVLWRDIEHAGYRERIQSYKNTNLTPRYRREPSGRSSGLQFRNAQHDPERVLGLTRRQNIEVLIETWMQSNSRGRYLEAPELSSV